ncbi:MAG: glycosyltransferase family 2 protein, partial [Tepidisphaeraceae bacterium]
MSLSVCMLTRNEESQIARAIASVRSVADQIVVADSASTDRTVEIAAQAGAQVIPFAWDDDFAAGRAYAIAQATCDWILWINASEELLPASAEPLRTGMLRADAFGYFVRIRV